MVVDDLDFFRISVMPGETDSILSVNADAVLSPAITGELLRATAGRHSVARGTNARRHGQMVVFLYRQSAFICVHQRPKQSAADERGSTQILNVSA